MSTEPAEHRTPRRYRRWVLLGMSIALVSAVFAVGSPYYQRQQWIDRVNATGAKVIRAGYGTTNSLVARVPILSDLMVRTQIEVFLPNPEAADKATPLLQDGPEIGRIWVNLDNISRDHQNRLRETFPGIDFVRYTN